MNQHQELSTLAVPVNHNDHFRGSRSAKVTLVEYGDFECPSCGQAYTAVNMFLKHFGDNVRFVFRHFPLWEIHPHAEYAAEAAETAGAQKKFWAMHALLFENQSHLSFKDLRRYAERAELDLQLFSFDMNDHTYLQRIQEHVQGGNRSGVHGTPTFFVNGAKFDLSLGFEDLYRVIDDAL